MGIVFKHDSLLCSVPLCLNMIRFCVPDPLQKSPISFFPKPKVYFILITRKSMSEIVELYALSHAMASFGFRHTFTAFRKLRLQDFLVSGS